MENRPPPNHGAYRLPDGRTIRTARARAPQDADALTAERLGEPGALGRMDGSDPALVCLRDGELVGLCFGHRNDHDGLTLDGIAIAYDHANKGLGGRLLAAFEEHALAVGYRSISLGSADGYVERFYLSHGYQQTEYMVKLNDENFDLDLTGFTVPRCRRGNGQSPLMATRRPPGAP